MTTPIVGQIYRDTYFDGINGGRQANRTIRIVAILDGEKAATETITDVLGNALAKPRKGKVSFKTLRGGYVLVEG